MKVSAKLKSALIIAKKVRNRMEEFVEENPDLSFDEDLTCLCAVSSEIFINSLNRKGIRADLVAGEYDGKGHAWVEVYGFIIDVTATQFTLCDKVHVVEADDEIYEAMLYNDSALAHIYGSWPEKQRLNSYIDCYPLNGYNYV
jgi:hypothetical protein